MKGKATALTLLNTIMTKRAEIEASLMRDQGYSPLQARREADKLLDPKKIKTQIEVQLNPKKAAFAAMMELNKRNSGSER